ncbi:hypothetical protein G9A89_014311 [Geosiphon pyriformis]|nr:hypothetical protein G9A89_014311 [Geosiphon pyriformis]
MDPRSPMLHWFVVFSKFLKGQDFSFSYSAGFNMCGLDILKSGEFSAVKDGLHDIWSGFFEVFTDGSLRNAGSAEIASSAAAQVVINAYMSELSLVCPDFHNQCWLKRHYIFNLIRDKNLVVSWIKVKGHFRVSGNKRADLAARAVSGSFFSLLAGVCKHFLIAEGTAVSSNVCYFVRDIFQLICHAYWEAGPGYDVIPDALIGCIDWVVMAKMWHPDSHMLTGFTSHKSLMLHTYLIKAVHRRLPVAIRKKLYNKCYPGVLCLLCGGVEFPDHAFTCVREFSIRDEILVEASAHWSALADVFNIFLSTVL